VVILQETMGDKVKISGNLSKILKDWEFLSLYSIGRFGVLIMVGGNIL
jgi:hypothetical protein